MTSASRPSNDVPRGVVSVDAQAATDTTDAPVRRPPVMSIGARQGGRWRSSDLFGPAQEIEIEHGQAIYRLRRTSLGKLILTK
jgi:hemin uptake protein HemP